MKTYQKMLFPLVAISVLSGCGGGGGGSKSNSNSSDSNQNQPPINTNPNNTQSNFTLKLTVGEGQSIYKIKEVDDGFVFVGSNILGGSIDGVNWYSQKVDGGYADVDGESLKYSAVNLTQCPRSKMAITMDGGKTWVEPEKDATGSCGIEGNIARVIYSESVWLYSTVSNFNTTLKSNDGITYESIFSGTKNKETYLPTIKYSIKQRDCSKFCVST